MNYVKIIVTSNYANLRLFVKENETYKALELIRSIHDNAKAEQHDYSPYRGHYKRPANNLLVEMRRVRIDIQRKRWNKLDLRNKLNELCNRSFNMLNSKLKQYSQAA